MARAYGIHATMAGAFESTYGTPPATGWRKLGFVSSTLGAEQPLIEDDQLGGGREGFDPTYDVITNDGDVVVPVDDVGFGWWLKLLLGAPVTSGTGPYTHVFHSGEDVLPSASIEVQHPKIPAFEMNKGMVANQMRIAMARSGMLNATFSLIGQGDVIAGVTGAGTLTALTGTRLQPATGQIKKDDVALGTVVSADLVFSNGVEKVETIRADGMIDGADPVLATMTGSITVRYADLVFLNAAQAKEPIDISFGWSSPTSSLLLSTPRLFLPKPKRTVSGPGGIMATYNFQSSGQGGHHLVARLVTSQATY